MLARSRSWYALCLTSGLLLAGCGQQAVPQQTGSIEGFDPDPSLTRDVVQLGPETADMSEMVATEALTEALPAEIEAIQEEMEVVSYSDAPAGPINGVPDKRMLYSHYGMEGRGQAARSAASGGHIPLYRRSASEPDEFNAGPPALKRMGSAAAGPAQEPLVQKKPDHQALPGQAEAPEAQQPAERGERYQQIVEGAYARTLDQPLSTFSIDVDTASYSHMRRYLRDLRQAPPDYAVRIEEYLNYFKYDYAPPKDSAPFAAHLESATCFWEPRHKLVRIGLKGKEIAHDKRPLSNLVFLIDVSGSMNEPDKLPLVKQGLRMLIEQLGENDRVAITVYAGAAGLVLPSTTGDKKSDILRTLDALQAGGSTAGGAGIELAYSTALANFIKGGANRVILCTDGDFNVGLQRPGDLQKLIEAKAKSGVFLSVLGFGQGNIRDDIMETLADKGNGVYAHLDSPQEARKVFVEQMSGTLVTIAKDVKIQVEFNPAQVAAYRLIGYENRVLAARDFNDDKKDAGEIGAGHTVTALYEIVPVGVAPPANEVDKLRYQKVAEKTEHAGRDEMLWLKLRYKQPDADQSVLLEFPLEAGQQQFDQASVDFRFAAAVASYGMLLRNSPHAGNATWGSVIEIAEEAKGADTLGYRKEFLELVTARRELGARP